jgi:tetratricopeptide (TPR) repeat protein/TolB-like protein
MPFDNDSPTPHNVRPDEAKAAVSPAGLTFQPGTLILGRFRVVRFIARGGMGELYEAADLELNEHVALKTIRPEIAANEKINQRFKREVQLARKITHPNICRIFDLFQHQSVSFVTMELLEGETLSEFMEREGPLTLDRAMPIALQMSAALASAHAVGIIHRDFKSSNVMILRAAGSTNQPRVVVTDFGLAYSVSDTSRDTNPPVSLDGDVIGTPEYMAPEQLQGGAVTPATDIYALGIVLYEMVTGVQPFAAPTRVASALRRISGPPPQRPRAVVQNVSDVWDSLIMRCLDSNPANRFADGAAVIAALQSEKVSKQHPPSRRLFASLVVAFVLLAAVGVAAWITWKPKPQPSTPIVVNTKPEVVARPAVAVLGFRNLTGRKDTEWLSLALAEMLTTELTATEAVRTVPGENINRMKTELKLADADSFSPETLARIKQNLATDFVVFGSYVTVGDGNEMTIRLDVRLQDSRSGQTPASFGETGKQAALLDVVSKVGGRLRERLGVELKPDSLVAVRASEPSSPEAARLYAEGLLRLRSFDAIAARNSLERAVQVDANFPLAHSALANAWSTLGYDERARLAAERAYQLSSGLSRADRLQVEGTYREMTKSWKEAITAWRTLVDLFPDDIEHTLRLANAQISSGAAKDGLSTIETFRNRFPAIQDPRLDLMSASAAEALSDFKRMEALAAGGAESGQAQGARLLVATAKLRQGVALMRQGQNDRATALIEEARRIYNDAGDRLGVARALNNYAAVFASGPDPRKSLTIYEESLGIARAVGNQDLVARNLNNMAIQHRRAGDLQASLRMNQESLAIRREIGDRTNEAISLNNIGNVLLDLDDLKGAAEHYEKSAAMSRETGDRQGLARALHNAAEALRLQGQLARARETVEEALKIRRSINDLAGVGSSSSSVGLIALLQGDLSTAKQTLNEGLEIARRLNNTRDSAFDLFFLGQLALIQGDLAGAQRQNQEALQLRTQSGEKVTAAASRGALAIIALEQNRPVDAESLAREAATVFESQHIANNEAMARTTVALAMLAQAKRDPARREIERARALLGNTQNIFARMEVAIGAARIQASNDAPRSARELESVRSEAVRLGLPGYEFEARRALAAIEGPRSTAGAVRLAALQKDAQQRGFLLYAH